MNTQHTPGPWKVRTAYSNGEPVCYTIYLGQTSIADVTSLSEQDRVNAALIAAAPLMKQELEGVRKYLMTLYDNGNSEAGQYATSIDTTLAASNGEAE